MILDYSPASYLTLCLSYRSGKLLFGLLRLLAINKNSAGGWSPGGAILPFVKKFYQLRARERLKLANSRS